MANSLTELDVYGKFVGWVPETEDDPTKVSWRTCWFFPFSYLWYSRDTSHISRRWKIHNGRIEVGSYDDLTMAMSDFEFDDSGRVVAMNCYDRPTETGEFTLFARFERVEPANAIERAAIAAMRLT